MNGSQANTNSPGLGTSGSLRAKAVLLLGLLLAVKLGLLVLDHDFRFFLGDSDSYLHTAFTGWIPPDRSFLYGYLIGRMTRFVHRLDIVIFIQVCA